MNDSENPIITFNEGSGIDKKRFRFSWTGWLGIIIVTFWVIMAFAGPYIAPFHEAEWISDNTFDPIGTTYLLGTDYLGRDVLSRVLWGARITMGLAFAATVIAYLVGVTLGIAAAVSADWVDTLLSRLNDAFLSLPTILLGLIVIAALGSSLTILVFTAGLIYASSVFRIARALAKDVFVQDFVEVARARGETIWWIIFREVLPNIIMPISSDFGIRLVFVILFIAGLSFLGLGVQPPMSDWGSMVRENLQGIAYSSPAPLAPAFATASLTIAINFIVDDFTSKSGGALIKEIV